MMAAKGLVPMPPAVLASVAATFLNDPETEIQNAARDSLKGMPNSMIAKFVNEDLNPAALDFFAREKLDQEGILETIILNNSTEDKTMTFLAEKVVEKLSIIIGNNQVRLMRT